MDVPELGSAAARARTQARIAASTPALPPGEVVSEEENTTPPEPEIIEADTAFIVILMPDGRVGITNDLDAPVTVNHPAGPEDVNRAFQTMQQQAVAQQQEMQAMLELQKRQQGH